MVYAKQGATVKIFGANIQYLHRIKEGRTYKAMTLPRKDMLGDDMVT